jgi:hypothetical protein
MANVTENSVFDAGIYQLETTDPVEGGSLGIANAQAKGLANRTRWLFDAIAVINTWISTVKFLLFLQKGTVSVGDIAGSKVINVTFPSLGTSNYMVNGMLVSRSSNYNNDIQCTVMVRSKTDTGFTLIVSEPTGFVQNLDFDYVIIPF